jgi:hypothetical protein
MGYMNFYNEVEFNGKVFVTYKSLEVSCGVNLEALKCHVKEKKIIPYRVWITEGHTISPDSHPSACSQTTGETRVDVRPYFPRENDKEIIWIYTSYCKSDLEELGLIPTADTSKENDPACAVRESMELAIQAAYIVGKWVVESGGLPGKITESKVRDILGQNDYGFGDTALFKAVWKAIPHSDKRAEVRAPTT